MVLSFSLNDSCFRPCCTLTWCDAFLQSAELCTSTYTKKKETLATHRAQINCQCWGLKLRVCINTSCAYRTEKLHLKSIKTSLQEGSVSLLHISVFSFETIHHYTISKITRWKVMVRSNSAIAWRPKVTTFSRKSKNSKHKWHRRRYSIKTLTLHLLSTFTAYFFPFFQIKWRQIIKL